MLLRRITQNVQAQNWIAIGIDFLVVVVGIFIGLQVDGWNDERKERIRETSLLEQLYVDFENNLAIVDEITGFHADKVAEIDFAIDIITEGEISESDHRRFMFAILSMYQLPPLSATMGSYEAVIASGDLALIKDSALKTKLIQLDSDIAADASLLAYFRDSNQAETQLTRGFATVEPDELRGSANLQLNFEAVTMEPLALTIVSGQKRNHQVFQQSRQNLARQFADIHTHIGALLGLDMQTSG